MPSITNGRLMIPQHTQQAYQHCLRIARHHYENFPVASRLLPRRLRYPIAAIYAFARQADDLADEGSLSNEQRLEQLAKLRQKLATIESGKIPDDPVYIALADTISQFHLPMEYFYDLLSAFEQDVEKKRYEDFGELMDYCRHSANPVGRLLLHLNGTTGRRLLGYSDAICSALQLINFYQDLQQDYEEMGRIYIPQDEMRKHHVTEKHFASQSSDASMQALMRQQIQRANKLLNAGAPLGKQLGGRLGFEIRLITAAASRVIMKLHAQDDVFSRPRLQAYDWLWVFWKALRAR